MDFEDHLRQMMDSVKLAKAPNRMKFSELQFWFGDTALLRIKKFGFNSDEIESGAAFDKAVAELKDRYGL